MNKILSGIVLFSLVILFSNCNERETENRENTNTSPAYLRGFGEMMVDLQMRHIKLAYAGEAENWPLADFYLHELEETIETIVTYHPEKSGFDMDEKMQRFMNEVIQLLEESVENENSDDFQDYFQLLTHNCNACHMATGYDIIRIKTPEPGEFSNQIFGRNGEN